MLEEIKGLRKLEFSRVRHMKKVMTIGEKFIPKIYDPIKQDILKGLFLHDMGYSTDIRDLDHNEAGAEIQLREGFEVGSFMALSHCKKKSDYKRSQIYSDVISKLSRGHKGIFPDIERDLWLIVSLSDLSVNEKGDYVSIGDRLDSIGKRHGVKGDKYINPCNCYVDICRNYKDTEVYKLYERERKSLPE